MKSLRSKISPLSADMAIQFVARSEVISALRPFLSVSRVFGLPSFSLVESLVSKGGPFSFLGAINIILMLNQGFLIILELLKGSRDILRTSGPLLILRAHVFLTHLWALVFSTRFSKGLRGLPILEQRLRKVYDDETVGGHTYSWRGTKKIIWFWTVVYILASLGLTFIPFFISGVQGSASEVWGSYAESVCALPPSMILQGSVASAYCLASEIATNFAWLFPNALIIVMSLVLGQLHSLIHKKGIQRVEPTRLSSLEIDLVREHHALTSRAVKEVDDSICVLNAVTIILDVAFVAFGAYSLLALRRKRETPNEMGNVTRLGIKVGVAAMKCLLALMHASYLHFKGGEGLSEVRSWPMARDFTDFSLANGRASVISAFVAQLSGGGGRGFSLAKALTISGRIVGGVALGIGLFLAFAKITISSCSTKRS